MLLACDSLSVQYGRVRAVRGVSLAVDEGEVVAVLGANGAGKSSLLRALLGLVPAAAGTVRMGEVDVTRWSPRQRLRHGLVLVPEGRRIVAALSVEENLRLGAWGRRDRAAVEKEIGAAYERFPNLATRRKLPASVLSGGEQQMLAIARGLMARPRLMMLDEPSLGLSPLLVEQLFDYLGQLKRGGLALLLVEQNTRKALALASRGCVLELGQVTAEGPSERLVEDESLAGAYLGGLAGTPPAEGGHPSAPGGAGSADPGAL